MARETYLPTDDEVAHYLSTNLGDSQGQIFANMVAEMVALNTVAAEAPARGRGAAAEDDAPPARGRGRGAATIEHDADEAPRGRGRGRANDDDAPVRGRGAASADDGVLSDDDLIDPDSVADVAADDEPAPRGRGRGAAAADDAPPARGRGRANADDDAPAAPARGRGGRGAAAAKKPVTFAALGLSKSEIKANIDAYNDEAAYPTAKSIKTEIATNYEITLKGNDDVVLAQQAANIYVAYTTLDQLDIADIEALAATLDIEIDFGRSRSAGQKKKVATDALVQAALAAFVPA